jgi:hypothetical protein
VSETSQPTETGFIRGGYYLKARCIQEAEIAKAPPHIREIWDWLLKEANHRDVNIADTVINRGQCIRSYRDIQDGLSWYVGWRKQTYSKWDCEKAMKWLTKHTMIATGKTTRGILITIVKYDYYQNPKNYENHTETGKRTTRKPQTRHTINKNEKNEKEEVLPKGNMSPEESGNGNCPHQAIVALYHKHLPTCPEIVKWTKARAAHLRARWNENEEQHNLEWWEGLFREIARSKFLTGRATGKDSRPFFASLDWIVKPENLAKILEGRYHE